MQEIRIAWAHFRRFFSVPRLCELSILATLQGLVLLPVPFLVGQLFDAPNGYSSNFLRAMLLVLTLTVLSSAVLLYIRYQVLSATKFSVATLRERLIATIYDLPTPYFGDTASKSLHTLIVEDTERIDVMANALVAQFMPALVASAALISILLYIDWRLATGFLALAFLALGATRLTGRALDKRVATFRTAFDRFSQGVAFSIRFAELTAVQGAEPYERGRRANEIEALRRAGGSMAWLASLLVEGQILTFAVLSLAVIGGGKILGDRGWSELVSFYLALGLLKGQCHILANALPPIFAGYRSLEAVVNILAGKSEASPPPTESKSLDVKEVVLSQVGFRYGEKPLLDGVSLTLRPGEITSVSGPNGSGKTTLVRLLLGRLRPMRGKIQIDGISLDGLERAGWLRSIGVVLQDATVFGDTIARNITYGAGDVDTPRLLQAARSAGLHDFVESLPERYDTFIGENGTYLSGGQKQKIALARAIYREPKLLILDEPTHHLDAPSVSRLLETLRELPFRPAILLISHDPAVLDFADKHLSLGKGIGDREAPLVPEYSV